MLAPRSSPTTTLVPPTSADLPTCVVVAFLAGLVARLALDPLSLHEQGSPAAPALPAESASLYQSVLDASIGGWPAEVIPDLLLRRVVAEGMPLLTGVDARRIRDDAVFPDERPRGGAYADLGYLLARVERDDPLRVALLAAAVAEALAPADAAVPLLTPTAAPALNALREALWRDGLHSWDTALLVGAHEYWAASRWFDAPSKLRGFDAPSELRARVDAAREAVEELRFPGTAERERRALQRRERRQERRRKHSAARRLATALAISVTPAHGRLVGRTSALLCDNRLTLQGPADVLAAFLGAIGGTPPSAVRRPAAGRNAGYPSHPLSLQKGLPMPNAVLMGSASEREAWALEHWGSPWDVEGPFQFLHRADEVVYEFRTLCVPPLKWFDELAHGHPRLSFTLGSDMRPFNSSVTHQWRDGLRQTRGSGIEGTFWTPAITECPPVHD